MGFWTWLYTNGASTLETISIVFGLWTGCYTIHANTIERRIQNLLSLTSAHRELWMHFEQEPDLHRIRLTSVDLKSSPVTSREARFVHLLILHLRASYKAKKFGMDFDDEAVKADIKQFFDRPVPLAVWKKSRRYQDRNFVEYVEQALLGSSEAPLFRAD